MKEDIINFNSKEQYHGYQERYLNDKLYYRGNSKNGERYGYGESHGRKQTNFYIR
jgi:hypothetical protein